VVISNSDGKMENSSASEMFMVISKIITDSEMFITKKTSSIQGFNGKIRKSTMITTNNEIALFISRPILLPPL
jgi:hypothetical protein